jgi:hypothetical protein
MGPKSRTRRHFETRGETHAPSDRYSLRVAAHRLAICGRLIRLGTEARRGAFSKLRGSF